MNCNTAPCPFNNVTEVCLFSRVSVWAGCCPSNTGSSGLVAYGSSYRHWGTDVAFGLIMLTLPVLPWFSSSSRVVQHPVAPGRSTSGSLGISGLISALPIGILSVWSALGRLPLLWCLCSSGDHPVLLRMPGSFVPMEVKEQHRRTASCLFIRCGFIAQGL